MKALMNLGCGPVVEAGWINVDRDDYDGALLIDALGGLPFDDATFDGVLMNHSLQAFTEAELLPVLGEVHRVLVPGGALRVLVPDVVAAFQAYTWGEDGWPGFVAIAEPMSLDHKLTRYLTWNGTNRTCFTAASLVDYLDVAGFHVRVAGPTTVEGLDSLDTRHGESLIVEVLA